MSLGLVNAIDEVVSAVEQATLAGRIELDDLSRIADVADRVFRLSIAAGLREALPRVDDIRHELNGFEGEIRFETALNVPVEYVSTSIDGPPFVHVSAVPLATSRWRQAMDQLRQLAITKCFLSYDPVAFQAELEQSLRESRDRDLGRPVAPLPTVTLNERAVLEALRKSYPKRVLLNLLEADTDINKKTIGKLLPRFVKLGFVDYDPKARKGASITCKGIQFLEGMSP